MISIIYNIGEGAMAARPSWPARAAPDASFRQERFRRPAPVYHIISCYGILYNNNTLYVIIYYVYNHIVCYYVIYNVIV